MNISLENIIARHRFVQDEWNATSESKGLTLLLAQK